MNNEGWYAHPSAASTAVSSSESSAAAATAKGTPQLPAAVAPSPIQTKPAPAEPSQRQNPGAVPAVSQAVSQAPPRTRPPTPAAAPPKASNSMFSATAAAAAEAAMRNRPATPAGASGASPSGSRRPVLGPPPPITAPGSPTATGSSRAPAPTPSRNRDSRASPPPMRTAAWLKHAAPRACTVHRQAAQAARDATVKVVSDSISLPLTRHSSSPHPGHPTYLSWPLAPSSRAPLLTPPPAPPHCTQVDWDQERRRTPTPMRARTPTPLGRRPRTPRASTPSAAVASPAEGAAAAPLRAADLMAADTKPGPSTSEAVQVCGGPPGAGPGSCHRIAPSTAGLLSSTAVHTPPA
ncbi:hypothetical protein HaLaN_31840, partial [Haematococcus lacustris]